MASVGFKTDKGITRSNNEDALFILPEQCLYIIADGVGGHNGGEIASRMAVRLFAEYVDRNPMLHKANDVALKQYFLDCLRQINSAIYHLSKQDKKNSGMATTVTAAYIRGETAYIMNVGDSRAYLIRDGFLRQITEDHTYVNELLKSGSITEEEAKCHPEKSMITRALGGDVSIVPDFFQFKIYSGDLILLCTDGLYGELSDFEICGMAKGRRSMHRLAGDYVNTANDHGGHDNITVICIKL